MASSKEWYPKSWQVYPTAGRQIAGDAHCQRKCESGNKVDRRPLHEWRVVGHPVIRHDPCASRPAIALWEKCDTFPMQWR